MKRFEITIKDNTDGKVRTLEGDFYLLSIPEDEGYHSVAVGRASSVDVVMCLMGSDYQREKLFKSDPTAAALYEHRDLFFSDGGTIDVAELERQLGKDIGS